MLSSLRRLPQLRQSVRTLTSDGKMVAPPMVYIEGEEMVRVH